MKRIGYRYGVGHIGNREDPRKLSAMAQTEVEEVLIG